LGWLKSQSIAPHIPVWDKSARDDGARSDFAYSAEQDIYICSQGKRLKTNGMLHDGKTLLYERANTIVSRARSKASLPEDTGSQNPTECS